MIDPICSQAMIDYDPGRWGVGFIWQRRGSVLLKTMVWAVPSAVMSYVVCFLLYDPQSPIDADEVQPENIAQVYSVFFGFLSFFIVFRTNQAYARYWDGAKLLRQARADWLSASSAVIAFCSSDDAQRDEVERFQHLLVRLMSMLVCTSLQAVSNTDALVMPVISLDGMEARSLEFLQSKVERGQKCEIILQWIQRLVAETSKTPALPIAPPILTRFFQELTNGVVLANEARNLSDLPFPFPYAQMMTVLLIIHILLTPVVMAMIMQNGPWAMLFTVISVLVLWGTNYIAIEIEYPFGTDENHLPLANIQEDVNASLWLLLESGCRRTPKFEFDKDVHRVWKVSHITLADDVQEAPGASVPGKLQRSPTANAKLFSATQADAPRAKPVLSDDGSVSCPASSTSMEDFSVPQDSQRMMSALSNKSSSDSLDPKLEASLQCVGKDSGAKPNKSSRISFAPRLSLFSGPLLLSQSRKRKCVSAYTRGSVAVGSLQTDWTDIDDDSRVNSKEVPPVLAANSGKRIADPTCNKPEITRTL